MILDLVDIKDPILRQKAKPVDKIDKKVKELISNMRDTLIVQNDPEGVGLAAPQVGKSLQIFLIYYEETEEVVINPKVISKKAVRKTKAKSKEKILEGCLSLPHYYGPINRTTQITIEFTTENGEKIQKTYRDFFAHIVEHEIDHLNGILFVDRILEQNQSLYKVDGDEWEEVELV